MSNDEKMGLAFVYFLVIAITANETGSPLLAVSAVVLMPVGAIIASKFGNSKSKR